MLMTDLIFFLVSCLVLVGSGDILVKSLRKVSAYLKISEFVVGFILMAFATSIPELFVGISSSLKGKSAFAIGNVIGANILNLTLVMGIIILLGRGIKIKDKRTKVDALYMAGFAALPLVLMVIGNSISRIDGAILIAAFLVYAIVLIRERREKSNVYNDIVSKRWEPVAYTALFVFGLMLLFGSSHFVVMYASALSIDLNVPPILIGLFLISIGTTLPELAFGTKAILRGHPEMALGDQIGSVVANSTLVLGVTALIFPISADLLLFFTAGIFMVVIAFLFATFVESGNKLYVKEGVSLILLYIFFLLVELYIKGVFH